ncbi:hypothetical protein AVEN_231181-1 [Araneus ventricosus]|uniref:Uncharacterized protein n=1 Tax=Araneus ventricosus TaxID=182803 RepID=A0A4Y2NH53_ARAVE|nr:hypothetical protein AVEN_231181-1 [Araneus ventricosus]
MKSDIVFNAAKRVVSHLTAVLLNRGRRTEHFYVVTPLTVLSDWRISTPTEEASADSEVPVPEKTTQEEANSSSEVLINTPQINLQPAEP